MISTNDFKTGVTIEVDGDIWQVVDFQHVKPGKGAAFVRAKLKNIRNGNVLERTFNAGEKIPRAQLDHREMQYLYKSGDHWTFMDTENYEQIMLTEDQLGDAIKYLVENMNVSVLMYQGQIIGVDVPNFVELKVIETEPGFKGDTATGATKPATVETGYVLKVPLFVDNGDIIRIDTRTGEYMERVKA